MRPLRKVVQVQFCQSGYSQAGHGSNMLRLECGHEVRRKRSIKVPKQCRCPWCDCYVPRNPGNGGLPRRAPPSDNLSIGAGPAS